MLYKFAVRCAKDYHMLAFRRNSIVFIGMLSVVLGACSVTKYLKGGIYRDLDESITIVLLTEYPERYRDKEIVFSVRYYKKGDLPCPLGDDYVNFVIADRVSYITLNKIWIKKDRADVLDSFKEMQTVVIKGKVFKIDDAKDPNIEALEIVPE